MLDKISIFLKEAENLSWCHWKSNIRIKDSLNGKTDLDILVAPEQVEIFKVKLKNCNFVEFNSPPWSNYSGVSNWIGHDSNSGKLIHFHLHERLLTGLKSVKAHSLPWNKIFLEAIIKDKFSGFPIIPPPLEIHLLFTRELAKSSIISRYYFSIFKKNIIDEFIINEMKSLLDLSDKKDILKWGNILWGKKNAKEISNILVSKDWFEFTNLNKLYFLTHNVLKKYATKSWYESFFLKVFNVTLRKISNFLSKFFGKFSGKMTLKKEGPIIAIIGCDGSGKTSLNNELNKWLSWKLESKVIYLGSKDMLLRSFQKKVKNNKNIKNFILNKKLKNKKLLRLFFAVYSAQIKLFKINKARYLSKKGKIILTDRLPQTEFLGDIYDSSSDLNINELNFLERFFFKYEKFIFKKMSFFKPDLIISLVVKPKVAIKRKPNHDFDILNKKSIVLKKLKFEGIRKIDIDANQDFEDVLKITKNVVWECIDSKNKQKVL